MNVTRETIKDLLPLYVSGEASPDSRALVESFLRQDSELEALAEALRAGDLAVPEPAAVPAGAGLAALETTRRLLRRRTRYLAFALLFTGLPFSIGGDETGLHFLLIRDAPVVGSAFLAIAVALWIAFAVTVRRLRVSGL